MAYGSIAVDTITSSTGVLNTPSINSVNTFGFKNRVINGAMVIDQRNAGVAVTTNDAFPVDRFKLSFANSTGAFSAQQTTIAPAGFSNSIKYLTTTADVSQATNEYATLYHVIEGLNTVDLAWGTVNAATVTISFWCRSSITGIFGGSLRNSGGTRSYPFSYTIFAANTWEYKTITVPGDTSGTWLTTNGAGIYINFGMGTGATLSGTADLWTSANYISATGTVNLLATLNADFYLTGVQLEKGPVATGFDFRDSASELQLCQRYYEPRSVYSYAKGTEYNTQGWGFVAQYSTKRATPTLTCTAAFTNPTSRVTTTAAIITSAAAIDGGRLFVSAEL